MNNTLKLISRIVLLASVITSCDGGVEKPTQDLDIAIPAVGLESGGGALQCVSKMMNGNEKIRQYRNTYFVIGMDGTEIIQSQAVGTEPCP